MQRRARVSTPRVNTTDLRRPRQNGADPRQRLREPFFLIGTCSTACGTASPSAATGLGRGGRARRARRLVRGARPWLGRPGRSGGTAARCAAGCGSRPWAARAPRRPGPRSGAPSAARGSAGSGSGGRRRPRRAGSVGVSTGSSRLDRRGLGGLVGLRARRGVGSAARRRARSSSARPACSDSAGCLVGRLLVRCGSSAGRAIAATSLGDGVPDLPLPPPLPSTVAAAVAAGAVAAAVRGHRGAGRRRGGVVVAPSSARPVRRARSGRGPGSARRSR